MQARAILVAMAGAVVACSEPAAAPAPAGTAGGGAGGSSQGGTSGGGLGGGGAATSGGNTGGAAAGTSGGGSAAAGVAGSAPLAGSPGGGTTAGSGGTASNGRSSLAGLYCPEPAPAYPGPLSTGASAQLVPLMPPSGIEFLEGPVWLADRGVLLMSEWRAGHRILQLTPPQAVEVLLPVSRTNGLILAPAGDALLMVTETPTAGVARFDLTTQSVDALVESYHGESFVQPNDLAVRADGTLFFTDYQAGRLYRGASDEQVTLVASQPHANGVGISPDERTLYLNSDQRTLAYPLADDSALGQPSDLTDQVAGADGLAIDCAGNVYIAQNEASSVLVVSPAGDALGEIALASSAVTNAAFGGPQRKTLYMTTASALYSIELAIPGLPY